MTGDPRSRLPGVDVLLASGPFRPLLDRHPRSRVVQAARDVLNAARRAMESEAQDLPGSPEGWADRVQTLLDEKDRESLRRVVNATGVVIHTNLGRAPLSESTREAMGRAGRGYANLEFDLGAGERGSRYTHCVDLLKELTGAEDALVVNNNAAAVVLGLNTMATGREVLVSRGELVEIGGGFRIPDMLSRSGAILREVGTTNRTRVEDYREATREGETGAILKVHRSNFKISGFTEEASLTDLADLARERNIFLFHDLGSGLLADPADLGLPQEPRAPESLQAGVDAVAVSGDKLLGGPQAGIILGTRASVSAMKKNPLCRAFRVDKVTLAGLEATLRHYLDPKKALREIPVLRMLANTLEDLEGRTRAMARGLSGGQARVVEGTSVVGGGTYPGVELPTWNLRVRGSGASSQEMARLLRRRDPPIIVRVEKDEIVADLRTVDPSEDELVLRALAEVCGNLPEYPDEP